MRDYKAPPPPLRPQLHAMLLLVGADQVTHHEGGIHHPNFFALGRSSVLHTGGQQESDLLWLKASGLITVSGDRMMLTDTGRERVNHAPAQTYHRRPSDSSGS